MMQNKKWLSILLAVVVAFGLWIYVVAVENKEGNITLNNIPVTFSGADLLREDYDLLISNSNVSSGVNLTFSGRFTDLNNLQRDKDDLEVIINVSHLRTAQEHFLSYDLAEISFPSSVSTQNIALSSKEPNKIAITLGNLKKKPIDVKIQQDITVKDGYMPSRLMQNIDQVFIEGPEELVDRVKYAQAILKRENVDQSISATLPFVLTDENGEPVESSDIFCSTTQVDVTLPVLMYKDVPIEVQTIDGGGATAEDTVVDVSPSSIRLSGDPAVLEGIQSIKLSNIDLGSLRTNDEEIKKAIVLPEGCKSLSGEQEATVHVKIKNKAIRQVRVSSSNFQFIGCPSDMLPKSRTTVLLVTLRANEDDVKQITEDNLRVVADLSDLSLGNNLTVPVKIYVDGFEGAGVIEEGTYTIMIDVVPVDEAGETP